MVREPFSRDLRRLRTGRDLQGGDGHLGRDDPVDHLRHLRGFGFVFDPADGIGEHLEVVELSEGEPGDQRLRGAQGEADALELSDDRLAIWQPEEEPFGGSLPAVVGSRLILVVGDQGAAGRDLGVASDESSCEVVGRIAGVWIGGTRRHRRGQGGTEFGAFIGVELRGDLLAELPIEFPWFAIGLQSFQLQRDIEVERLWPVDRLELFPADDEAVEWIEID